MAEMNELFYKDPYMKEFDAVVLSCEETKKGIAAVLDDTAFYPEGGGQPCDHGTLNGIEVYDVKRSGEQVIHYLKHPLKAGEKVHGVIDWDRRFDHMQQHTGEHMVSGLIHKHYGYENVGFHLGEDVIQIDFDGMLTWEQLMEIEKEANELIYRNEKILITFPDKEELKSLAYRSKKELTGTVRIVTVPEADCCACCGTHVERTGEIGLIKILSAVKHKNGIRAEMVSGRRALQKIETAYDQNRMIAVQLSAKMHETASKVEALAKESARKEHLLHEMNLKQMADKLAKIGENEHLVIDFEDGADRVSRTNFCNDIVHEKHADIAAVMNKETNGYSYLIISENTDLRLKVKELNSLLNGRGGGKPDNIQGSFLADEDKIRTVLQEVFGR